MKYQLDKIKISNFRNINHSESLNNYFEYDIGQNELVILGGKNGYGKTTFFSAIELLITGQVKHVESGRNILNRGQVPINILANNIHKDIVIIGFFSATDKSLIVVTRTLCSKDLFEKYKLEIEKDKDKYEIKQIELMELLKTTTNIFHTASYISQSESLSFMSQKYKDRKESISHIINISEIINIEEKTKNYKNMFNRKSKEFLKEKQKKIEELGNKIKKIESTLSKFSSDTMSKENSYEKLFDKEFLFDSQDIDVELYDYEHLISEPKAILEFINDFEDYNKYLKNKEIKKEIGRSKREYKVVYFRTILSQLKQNQKLIEQIKNIKNISINNLLDYQYYKSYSQILKSNLIVEEKILIDYEAILNEENRLTNQLDENKKILNNIINERERLINAYQKGLNNGILSKDKCVLCGSYVKQIIDSIKNTTVLLRENISGASERIVKISDQKLRFMEESIRPKIIHFLESKKALLQNYNFLQDYLNLDVEKILENIIMINLDDFIYNLNEMQNDKMERSFENTYQKHIEYLSSKIKKTSKDISDHGEEYKRISKQYYENSKPHTKEQLQNKIAYISNIYNNKSVQKLQIMKKEQKNYNAKLDQCKTEFEKRNNKIVQVHTTISHALKEYQNQIAEGIQIPLFVFSGKILQNYHLGLGINIITKENQLVFVSNPYFENLDTKYSASEDVYNILSLGQLNALVIAIILAINITYNSHLGFNCILIDDPLQSIDDINSIGFADLLAQQFSNKKVILSTHELDKASLLTYKYKQANLNVKNINVMQKYLIE